MSTSPMPPLSSFFVTRRESKTASARVTETVKGTHLFTITSYSLINGMGIGKCFNSGTFNVGGHNWVLEYYPDGDKTENDATCVSVFLRLESDATDVMVQASLNIVDQSRSSSEDKSFRNTFERRGSSWGYSRFMDKAVLRAPRYLKDDSITIQCNVSVIKEPRTIEVPVPMTRSVAVTPTNLHEHLGQLLESKEGTDVTFEVSGETFAAHRCVLAARSPVFKAELFGLMKEKSMQCIKICDMEAIVFKALLHFIYRDSLPQVEELDIDHTKESATMVTQHLLVAADRYGLERLKLICEDELCDRIDVSTVATILALAEQHNCHQLKAVCIDFIASPEILVEVMLTDGFEHFKISCPLVLKELLEKFRIPNG